MKILLINTYENEGGAARAVYRLHKGLRSIGIESFVLVQRKTSDDYTVIGPETRFQKGMAMLRPYIDSLPLQLYRNREYTPWSTSLFASRILNDVRRLNPDIINLNWVCGGFVPIKILTSIRKPIVWTLHDSWPFTGGCHIPYDCSRYQVGCGSCPQLKSKNNIDLSKRVFNKKANCWNNISFTVVAPTRWLADCAQSSLLFKNNRIEIIPNGLDLKCYKPVDKRIARDMLNLSHNKKLILFGAMNSTRDPNKGFQFLQPALQKLRENESGNNIELIVFGASQPENSFELGFKTNYLGRFYDDVSLAVLYSASDVMCVPSIQEAFGQTASEAMACGTPVVAFNTTGLVDLVDHKQNGYLAKPFEIDDLAMGLSWVLSDENRWKDLSKRAREKVKQKFELEMVARKYVDLYEESFKSVSNISP